MIKEELDDMAHVRFLKIDYHSPEPHAEWLRKDAERLLGTA